MRVSKSILVGVLSLCIMSCEKFLDIESSDFLTLNNAYNTEQQLNAALTGVYDAMGGINATKGIYSDAMLLYGGLEGDLAYYGATNPSDGPQIYQFSATNKYVEYYWNALYLGIDRANVLLANMNNNPNIDIEKKKVIRGEALFLRGYYYFLLGQTFGGVPLKLEPSVSASFADNIPRSSLKETYTQILLDMKTAEPLVKDIDEIGYGGRVSKSAIQGIIARVHLYMAGYPLNEQSNNDSVIVWTKKVIDNVKYKHGLNPHFSEVFINYAKDKYDIKESIWEVEFYGNKSGAYDETGIVGIANGPGSSNEETGRATGLLKVTRKLYDLYQPWDLRRGWSIANFTYNSTGPNGSKTFRPLPSSTSIYNHCGG
ncbi:MAG: RagB/SusD family nutrient uptake outer membrane protein, partial [Bacteroidota bacterium]